MNQWMAAILLFTFKLVHIPGKEHAGPDGLSQRRGVEGDVEERDGGWVNKVLGLGVWVVTWMGKDREGEGTAEEDTLKSTLWPSFLLLSLSQSSTPDIKLPHLKDDIMMD